MTETRNRGAHALGQYKNDVGAGNAALALVFGCTEATVSQLLNSRMVPGSRSLALALQRAAGIDPAWWDEPYIPPTPTPTSAVATEPGAQGAAS